MVFLIWFEKVLVFLVGKKVLTSITFTKRTSSTSSNVYKKSSYFGCIFKLKLLQKFVTFWLYSPQKWKNIVCRLHYKMVGCFFSFYFILRHIEKENVSFNLSILRTNIQFGKELVVKDFSYIFIGFSSGFLPRKMG